jgi:hypothetical protein
MEHVLIVFATRVVLDNKKSTIMKNFKIILAGLILISANMVSLQGNAQETKFSINNVNLEFGWYFPSMNYWNDVFLPGLLIKKEFNGNINVGGELTFNLPKNFRIASGINYWSDKVTPDNKDPIKQFKISFTRISISVLYPFEKINFPIKPYLGLQGSFNMINNTIDKIDEKVKEQGQDYSWALRAGVENIFFNNLLTGIEFIYHFGSYMQDIETLTRIVEKKVSISGPEISLRIGYKFK